MNDPAQPAAARALRTVWRSPVPHEAGGAVAFASPGDRVAAGTLGNAGGQSSGSLTVFDTGTGAVVRQVSDEWRVHWLAYSPGGRSLATSESRSRFTVPDEVRVRILDADTFAERCRCTGDLRFSPSLSLSFSGDGGWVTARESLFGTPGSLAYMFAASDGTERWRQQIQMISSLALSADAGSVAVGCYQDGLVVIDARTGAVRRRVTMPSEVRQVAYSPDNRWIVAGCKDGTIHVFDAGSGTQAWSVRLGADPDGSIMSVTVSDDARWVAAVGVVNPGGAGILGVYDLIQGTPRFPPVRLGTSGEVLYSPTLRHIVVNCPYGVPDPPGNRSGLTVIDARTGLQDRSSSSAILNFAMAADGGSVVARGEGFVEMYDLGVEISRSAVDAPLTAMNMSATGMPLIAVGTAGPAVAVIDAASGIRLASKPVPGTITSLVFADQGQAVAVGGSGGVRLFSIVGTRSWKVDSIGVVNALAVAGATGEWIATAAGKTVRLLNSVDGHSRWPSPSTHPQAVTRIAASPDGKRIATGCVDRNTRILDAGTGTGTFSIEGDGKVQALAFTPDGALLATANEDGTVILIDTATGAERGRVTRLFGCSGIALSFDGALLAAAWDDNTVSIYDIAVGGPPPPKLRELAFPAPISGLAFNPAEHAVAVATAGASVVVYDARDGIELVRILQPVPVSHFAFGADGALITTTGDDRIVRVWTSGSPPGGGQVP